MQKKDVNTNELLQTNLLQYFINELESLKQEVAFLKCKNLPKVNEQDPNILFSMDEMCSLLRMPKGSLYNLTYQRKIGYVKIGRSIFFTQKHFDEYVEENSRLTKKQIAIGYNTKKACGKSRG